MLDKDVDLTDAAAHVLRFAKIAGVDFGVLSRVPASDLMRLLCAVGGEALDCIRAEARDCGCSERIEKRLTSCLDLEGVDG